MIYALVCLALIFADQLSKALAFALYGEGELVTYWLGKMFGINNVYNDGISFSWKIPGDETGEATQIVVIIVTCIAAAVILFFLCRLPKERRFLRWALVFILAGAVGNLIDRIAIGSVRDFIYMDFGFTRFSNNVADLEITVGAVLFIVALLFVDPEAVFRPSKKEEEKEVEGAVRELRGAGQDLPGGRPALREEPYIPSEGEGAPQEAGSPRQGSADAQSRSEEGPAAPQSCSEEGSADAQSCSEEDPADAQSCSEEGSADAQSDPGAGGGSPSGPEGDPADPKAEDTDPAGPKAEGADRD